MELPFVRADGTTESVTFTPSKIIGIGVNYRLHAVEMGKGVPDEPLMFLKPPSALLADGGEIERPDGYERVDHEAELGVVIAKRAKNVSVNDALSYVLGYTCVNDVSVRDLQKKDGQWARAKGFDSFCPVGPRIVEGLDPRNLKITATLNGELRQDSSTSDMIFSVAEIIAFASAHMTLEPGDLISTGTPSGVGNLMPGDTIEIAIEGIGALTNAVVRRQ